MSAPEPSIASSLSSGLNAITKLETELAAARRTIETLRASNAALEGNNRALSALSDDTTKKFEESESSFAELEATVRRQQEMLEELPVQIEAERERYRTFLDVLSKTDKLNIVPPTPSDDKYAISRETHILSAIDALRDKNEKLRAAITADSIATSLTETTVKPDTEDLSPNLEEQIIALKQKIEKMERAKERAEKLHEAMMEDSEHHEIALSKKEQAIHRLTEQQAEDKTEIERLMAAVRALETEINVSKQRIEKTAQRTKNDTQNKEQEQRSALEASQKETEAMRKEKEALQRAAREKASEQERMIADLKLRAERQTKAAVEASAKEEALRKENAAKEAQLKRLRDEMAMAEERRREEANKLTRERAEHRRALMLERAARRQESEESARQNQIQSANHQRELTRANAAVAQARREAAMANEQLINAFAAMEEASEGALDIAARPIAQNALVPMAIPVPMVAADPVIPNVVPNIPIVPPVAPEPLPAAVVFIAPQPAQLAVPEAASLPEANSAAESAEAIRNRARGFY